MSGNGVPLKMDFEYNPERMEFEEMQRNISSDHHEEVQELFLAANESQPIDAELETKG